MTISIKNYFWVLLGVGGLFLGSVAHAQWDQRVFKISSEGVSTELSQEALMKELRDVSTILIGEKHYTRAVQKAEARIIGDVVRLSGSEKAFTTAWEFLNATSQDVTDQLYAQVVSGQMTPVQFLKMTQGVELSDIYAPVIDVTRELGGKLLGVNLSRTQKTPVVKEGIGALDPTLLPPGFALGSEGYFDRFKSLMAGHGSPEKIQHYFEAQCLTDDVMAYHLVNTAVTPRKFLITGEFHTDFMDGAAARFKTRLKARPELPQDFAVVRIFDASDYEQKELMGLLYDERYGKIADYVFFVNEPMEDGIADF